MRRHERFEWDEAKARSNLAKHGVSFEQAAVVLTDDHADRFHWEWLDLRGEYGEDRWVTLASRPGNRNQVLCVVWTLRNCAEGPVTRIISARKATRTERKNYEQKIYPQ